MAEVIYIEGYIGQSDFFTEGVSLKTVRDAVNALPNGVNEIEIHINSGGGDVTEGFAIYDYLKDLQSRSGFNVTTIATGIVGSIATVIFMAGSKRKLHANTEFFIHNPYWTPQSPEPMEAKDAAALAEQLRKTEDKILSFYVKHTSKSADEIRSKMAAQTTFSAAEAVEWGFADEVIGEVATNAKRYAVMAFLNNNKTTINMDIAKMFSDFEAKITAKIDSAFKKPIKNEMHKTSEGVEVWYDGELSEGTSVWLDEAMTQPAPDGVHTVDGVTFEIKEGKVVSVGVAAATDSEEVKALKAQVADLSAKLSEKETAIANSTTEAAQLKAETAEAKAALENVKQDFQNFKGQFITDEGVIKPEFQNFKGDNSQPTDLIKATLELRKKQAEQTKK